jgi:prophage regulatory protein
VFRHVEPHSLLAYLPRIAVNAKREKEMAKRIITFDRLDPDKGIKLGKTQIWRNERDGKFPKRVQISPGRYGWVESEIDTYIEQKIAERDAKLAKIAERDAKIATASVA